MRADILSQVIFEIETNGAPSVTVHTPLDENDLRWFQRKWAQQRFRAQQDSIVHGHPDDQLFGRGSLWHYVLRSNELPEGIFIHFEWVPHPRPSVRELILLASVSEHPVPFENLLGEPLSNQEFHIHKQRMLGEVPRRAGIDVTLRPAVRTIQIVTSQGRQCLAPVDMKKIVRAG